MNSLLLNSAFICYSLAALALCLPSGSPGKRRRAPSEILLAAGFFFHTVMFFARWHAAGRPPFASMYEALVLFSWSVCAVYYIFYFLYRAKVLLVPVLILSIAMLLGAVGADSSMKPLVPALQSKWMSVHVITYFLGYGALSVAFLLGVLYLFASGKRSATPEELSYIDELSYKLIIFGFPFLTIGMTTGSAWADVAWGTYWGWDPKETCSLITWLVYVIYLHLRVLRGWKGSRAAWMSIIGFLSTLFTFIGVNYILPGLHSYTS